MAYILSSKWIRYSFLTLTINCSAASAEKTWRDYVTPQSACLMILSATATITAIKIITTQLSKNRWSIDQKGINEIRMLYKQIQSDSEYIYRLYRTDTQVDDISLKEKVIDLYKKPYPFIAYYSELIKNSWILEKHLQTIMLRLEKLDKHQDYLYTHKQPLAKAHLKQLLSQLKIKGKQLEEQILKSKRIISIIKKRIKLFKEYADDCDNWTRQTKS